MEQRFHKEFERDFYKKTIVTIIPTNLVTNSLLFLACPCRNQKQESNFQEVGDLVTRSISVFCL